MKVYVVGAGVSKTVGYPLGKELFDNIDDFIRSQRCFNRFDYQKDWPELCRWFETNSNPLVSQAYRSRQLEHLFTILDHSMILRAESLTGESWDYLRRREMLLWALEAYVEQRHNTDIAGSKTPDWNRLRAFCRKLCPGDAVITFNYDSTLERVLLDEKKWSPCDGYGFAVALQKMFLGPPVPEFDLSSMKVLHLHGAVGWYRNSSASQEPCLSLGPIFLRDLGINAVDASMPTNPPTEHTRLLQPSFLKTYDDPIFVWLWKAAAEALRKADEIVVIGYSLPKADSAALTLFLTNSDRAKVRIVNSDPDDNYRLRQLLSNDPLSPPQCFEDWLGKAPDCA